MVLVGIIIPILAFFISMNATFAYFTATAEKKQATSETAIVKIKFSDDTSTLINSSTVTSSVQLVPGDTLTIDGDLENSGNVAVYAILEFEVYVTKKDSTTKETAVHKYYTFVDSTLTEITGSAGNYSANATMLYVDSPNNAKSFTLNYLFDGNTYGNEYKNATVTYSVNGYAIQTVNIDGGASEATELLMMQSFDVPTEYRK